MIKVQNCSRKLNFNRNHQIATGCFESLSVGIRANESAFLFRKRMINTQIKINRNIKATGMTMLKNRWFLIATPTTQPVYKIRGANNVMVIGRKTANLLPVSIPFSN